MKLVHYHILDRIQIHIAECGRTKLKSNKNICTGIEIHILILIPGWTSEYQLVDKQTGLANIKNLDLC